MKIFIKIALFIENFIFPMLFLWSILNSLAFLVSYGKVFFNLISHFSGEANHATALQAVVAYIFEFSLLSFESVVFVALLLKKKIHKDPDNILEIIIPLLATFFYLSYNYVKYLPIQFNQSFLSDQFLPYCVVVGSIINIVGVTISSVATYHLRYSFSIFVEIRDIVSHGFYRYVRHPIYSGYIISTVGFFIMMPQIDFLLLGVLSTIILIYRAHLEEKKLIESSQVYREYAQKTPAFFPKIKFQ